MYISIEIIKRMYFYSQIGDTMQHTIVILKKSQWIYISYYKQSRCANGSKFCGGREKHGFINHKCDICHWGMAHSAEEAKNLLMRNFLFQPSFQDKNLMRMSVVHSCQCHITKKECCFTVSCIVANFLSFTCFAKKPLNSSLTRKQCRPLFNVNVKKKKKKKHETVKGFFFFKITRTATACGSRITIDFEFFKPLRWTSIAPFHTPVLFFFLQCPHSILCPPTSSSYTFIFERPQ